MRALRLRGNDARQIVLTTLQASGNRWAVGYAYDDAWCESLFATVECELFDRRRFAMVADARGEVFSFIEGVYKRITDKEDAGRWTSTLRRTRNAPYTDDTSAYKPGIARTKRSSTW